MYEMKRPTGPPRTRAEPEPMTRPVPIEPPIAICSGVGLSVSKKTNRRCKEALGNRLAFARPKDIKCQETHHRDVASLETAVQVLVFGDALVDVSQLGGREGGTALLDGSTTDIFLIVATAASVFLDV